MKTLRSLVVLGALAILSGSAIAQSDSTFASRRALMFADSLLASFRQSNIALYTDLSYPGIVQYYGGKKNFEEYLKRTIATTPSYATEYVSIVQLVNNTNEWQCVIQKTRDAMIDDRRATITTYMVGQSVDNGRSWKFFDVPFNPANNIVYIMPDIFSSLVIPRREVVFYHTTSQATVPQGPSPQAHL